MKNPSLGDDTHGLTQHLDHMVWHIIQWLVWHCCECYRFLESHWFVWVTQMNHLPMDIDHEKHQDWLTMQVTGLLRSPLAAVKSTVTRRFCWCINSSALFCLIFFFSCKPPVILSSRSSTTGSVDTSTFKSNTSKSNHWVSGVDSWCQLKVGGKNTQSS